MLLRLFANCIIKLNVSIKKSIVIFFDLLLAIFSMWLAYALRLDNWYIPEFPFIFSSLVSIFILIPIFTYYGIYSSIYRYIGFNSIVTIFKALISYAIVFVLVIFYIQLPGLPRSIAILQPIILFFCTLLLRGFILYLFRDINFSKDYKDKNPSGILIYGVGYLGRHFARTFKGASGFKLVGFIDDDVTLQGRYLDGLKVYSLKSISTLIEKLSVKEVLIAVSNQPRSKRLEIISRLRQYPVHTRILPNFKELTRGKVGLTDAYELEVEDLLDRETVVPDQSLLIKNINDKVVMVTGARGSIGGELCRQIIECNPKVLILLDNNEFALYKIHKKVLNSLQDTSVTIIPVLASVLNENRVQEVVERWQPHIIYHAAAYKHVPIVEQNPLEGISNNVFGTLICAKIAAKNNVPNFLLISTDKAVRPTNIMGATKRLSEIILQALSGLSLLENNFTDVKSSKTLFSMVRFGNVLGSSGSVVPLFREQIKNGGPISLTHPEVNRFFMTVPEAAQLVLQASAMTEGGDVFILNMGKPILIYDLARQMIEQFGLKVKDDSNPGGDIEIQITGLRPGEKLFEELLIGDNPEKTSHNKIMRAKETYISYDVLFPLLKKLKIFTDSGNVDQAVLLLSELVPDYKPTVH